MRHPVLLGAVALVAHHLVATPAAAQDAVAQFYAGRQVTIVIGSSPGGGYDTYGRLLSRHIGRHIPGKPAVVASNMPGAGSNVAASHVMTSAARDGTFVGIIFASVIVEPLLGERGKQRFDPAKLAFVANANDEVFTCVVRAQSPVRSIEDMRSRELVVGASATGGATVDFPTMLNAFLGTRTRIVRGYPGTREITLAIEKGEVEGACGLSWATTSVQYPRTLAEGQPLRIILQEDMAGHRALDAAGIQVSGKLPNSEENRKALELFYLQNRFGRPFVMSPEVPSERLAAMRQAFAAAMSDPELLADAKRLNIDVIPSTGEQMQALVTRMYATPPEVVARVRKALGQDK